MARVTKKLNGEEKEKAPTKFVPANPHHKYDSN